jgi:hypothetical protein
VDLRADLDDVEKRKFLALQGLELRPLGRPARNQSLYRLRYPGSFVNKEYASENNDNFLCNLHYLFKFVTKNYIVNNNIVARRPVARQKTAKEGAIQQPLLGNGSVNNGRC